MRSLIILALLAAGCESEVDNSPNVLLVDAAIEADLGEGECLPEVGDWYIFDTLFVVDIAGNPNHGAVGNLNTIWAADIERMELNVLFEVLEASPEAVKVRALNAARIDGEQALCLVRSTETELSFVRDGNTLTMEERAGINIYAGTESIPKNCGPTGEPKHTIPIRETRLTGQLTPDCGRIVNGVTLEAVMFGEALKDICSCISPTAGAEQCGPLDASYDSGSFGCDGCNPLHRNLEGLLVSLTPPNEDGERVLYEVGEDGVGRIRLTAGFTAERIEAPPECTRIE